MAGTSRRLPLDDKLHVRAPLWPQLLALIERRNQAQARRGTVLWMGVSAPLRVAEVSTALVFQQSRQAQRALDACNEPDRPARRVACAAPQATRGMNPADGGARRRRLTFPDAAPAVSSGGACRPKPPAPAPNLALQRRGGIRILGGPKGPQ